MGIFDNIIKIDKNEDFSYNGWVEWDHFMIPNQPEWLRKILRDIMAMLGHCLSCTSLDGCYLLNSNKPEMPLHTHCDCNKKNVGFTHVKSKAHSECAIEKFTKYIFRDDGKSRGKSYIFYKLGYSVSDSLYLRDEYCYQALKQYLLGNYKLKNLDENGQRLAIPINLKGVEFYSGWLLCPEGKIKNTTPFGGWIK